jgi:ferredoxin-like protein FixX
MSCGGNAAQSPHASVTADSDTQISTIGDLLLCLIASFKQTSEEEIELQRVGCVACLSTDVFAVGRDE